MSRVESQGDATGLEQKQGQHVTPKDPDDELEALKSFLSDTESFFSGISAAESPDDPRVLALARHIHSRCQRGTLSLRNNDNCEPDDNGYNSMSGHQTSNNNFDAGTSATALVRTSLQRTGVPTRSHPTLFLYSRVDVPTHLYDRFWATSIPELHAELSEANDNPFALMRAKGSEEDFALALQGAVESLEVTFKLNIPCITALLVCEVSNNGDESLRRITEAILLKALCCRDVSALGAITTEITSRKSPMITRPSIPYKTDYAELPGCDLVLGGDWSWLLKTLTLAWAKFKIGSHGHLQAKQLWLSLSQRKHEPISEYFRREDEAWQRMEMCFEFKNLSPPSEYDRILQIARSIHQDVKNELSKRIKRERVKVETLTHSDLVQRLLIVEEEMNTTLPWEDPKQRQPREITSSEGYIGATSIFTGQANNPKVAKKEPSMCRFCNKLVMHNPDNCWENPSCTVRPSWYTLKSSQKKPDDKEEPVIPTYMVSPSVESSDALTVSSIDATLISPDTSRRSCIVGVDTLSEYNLIDDRLTQSGLCDVVNCAKEDLPQLAGFRGTTFRPHCKVRLHVQIGGQSMYLYALSVNMATTCVQMDMIIGFRSMQRMGANLHLAEKRFEVPQHGISVSLSPLQRRSRDGSTPACALIPQSVEDILLKSDTEIVADFKAGLKDINYEAPVLDFSIPEALAKSPFQCSAPYGVPSGLWPGTMKRVNEELEMGNWVQTKLGPEQWVSACFPKSKGRTYTDDRGIDREEVRLLIDLRRLNSVICIPHYYRVDGQSKEVFLREVPETSRYFCTVDVSNAFSTIRVSERSSNLLCLRLGDAYYRSLVALQGLSISPLYWRFHLRHGLVTILGPEVLEYTAIFVDDILIYAPTRELCEHRRRLICCALWALDKQISSKVPAEVREYADCIGFRWSQGGVVMTEHNEAKLRRALSANPSSAPHLRRVIGSIKYASTAFRKLERFCDYATIMKTLHQTECTKPFHFSEEAKQALVKLSEAVTLAPMALHSYRDLVDGETRCWVIVADASDVACGAGLYRVTGQAKAITPDILQDASRSSLVSVTSKVLSQHELRWQIYEKEVFSVLHAVQTWYRLLVSTTRPISCPGLASDFDDKAKILVMTDSMICLHRWSTYEIPGCPLASPKVKRFLSWCEDVGEWRHLPMIFRHCKGISNDLADLLSRWATALAKSARQSSESLTTDKADYGGAAPAMMIVESDPEPPSIHHSEEGQSTDEEDLQSVYSEASAESLLEDVPQLPLTPEQKALVKEAQVKDSSVFQGVRLADIILVLSGGDSSQLPPIALTRIRKWERERFFFLRSEDGIQLLYTIPIIRDGSKLKLGPVIVVPECCPVNLLEDRYDKYDLRSSILYLLHDTLVGVHNSTTPLLNSVLRCAWWPSVSRDVRDHRARCPVCRPKTFRKAVGKLPSTHRRFSVISIDHKCIPPVLVERMKLSSTACVISVIDLGTGEVCFDLLPGQDARFVGRFLFCRIISRHGTFDLLCSDRGAAFVGQVVQHLSAMFAFRTKCSTARNPTGNSRVERAHQSISAVFDWLIDSGDGDSEEHMRIYLAAAESKINLAIDEDGLSVHHSVYGVGPNTPLLADSNVTADGLDSPDAIVVEAICKSAVYSAEVRGAQQDLKAHYNMASRMAANSAGSQADEHIAVGTEVLHQGVRDSIKAVYRCEVNGRPTSVELSSGLKAPVNELQPVDDGRPLHLLSAIDAEYKADDCVLYRMDNKGLVMIGRILSPSSNGSPLRVHVLDGGDRGTVFLPLWRLPVTDVREDQEIREVKLDEVICKVSISTSGYPTADSKARLHSLGVVQ
ncbi:hypothetical protein FOL47_009330 [Perkinsus chesapeaki]|uniref:Integrase catalytic domain-containing protein n=1 Tax=Perkinsus chesapeaki TaxID=330153 RepID=A0A7J6L908_PERCH|nr:hypothetical protein FOL47_009330 [Perkinsus chesapeaki]